MDTLKLSRRTIGGFCFLFLISLFLFYFRQAQMSDTCVDCHESSHPERTCATPRTEVGQRMSSKLCKILTTKNCPACKAQIQRSSGCKRMHCIVCERHFCWICRGSIVDFAFPDAEGRRCVCHKLEVTIF